MKIFIFKKLSLSLFLMIFLIGCVFHEPFYEKAIRIGDINKLKKYLKNGGNPNHVANNDMVLIEKAIFYNRKEMVKLLIDKGAKLNDYPGALYYSCLFGSDSILKLLIDNGAKTKGYDLLAAAAIGNKEKVRILIERGVNVNYMLNGLNAWMIALKYGNEDVADLLWKNGARIPDDYATVIVIPDTNLALDLKHNINKMHVINFDSVYKETDSINNSLGSTTSSMEMKIARLAYLKEISKDMEVSGKPLPYGFINNDESLLFLPGKHKIFVNYNYRYTYADGINREIIRTESAGPLELDITVDAGSIYFLKYCFTSIGKKITFGSVLKLTLLGSTKTNTLWVPYIEKYKIK
ncbi:MAG: ankyrin repeat domain-containing protein [Bacteroidales bacterium]|nr:ankyrin repeat domain-containing protein [Bacteroidales bacterium]